MGNSKKRGNKKLFHISNQKLTVEIETSCYEEGQLGKCNTHRKMQETANSLLNESV